MSETAQDNNRNTTAGFTTVQAYTLAVITLAIGIAVGYSPADLPLCRPPRNTQASSPEPWAALPWVRPSCLELVRRNNSRQPLRR